MIWQTLSGIWTSDTTGNENVEKTTENVLEDITHLVNIELIGFENNNLASTVDVDLISSSLNVGLNTRVDGEELCQNVVWDYANTSNETLFENDVTANNFMENEEVEMEMNNELEETAMIARTENVALNHCNEATRKRKRNQRGRANKNTWKQVEAR